MATTARLTAPSAPRNDVLAATQSQRGNKFVKEEEGEVIRVGSFIRIFEHSPVEVTTRNKVICSIAFSLSILSMVGVIAKLSLYHVNHKDIMEHRHFLGPVIVVYIILGIDIIACCVGIWTCLAKTETRQKTMLYVCIWLLLSSLFHFCACANLYMNGEFKIDPQQGQSAAAMTRTSLIPCSKADEDNPDCRIALNLTFILWCSCLLILVEEMITIWCCRFNYPQVFNWLLNKMVLLDEEIVENAVQSYKHIGSLGGAFFPPCDIERLAARGSLNGTDVVTLTASKTILVQKRSKDIGGDKI